MKKYLVTVIYVDSEMQKHPMGFSCCDKKDATKFAAYYRKNIKSGNVVSVKTETLFSKAIVRTIN